MTTDGEQLAARLRRAGADLAAPPELLAEVRAGGRRRLRRRRAASAAAAAALVAVVLGVPALWPSVPDRLLQVAGWSGSDSATEQPSPRAVVPARMAGYSYLTGSVRASPPGPALALYQQGFGVELIDFPQALVMSVDGETYRRVDLAERRAGGESQGDPAPMLLSPDGRQVAVGRYSARDADVALLDLTTGAVVRHAVPDARSVLPVAWSADGRWLAYLADEQPTNPHSGRAASGEPGLLDLTTGQVRTLPGRGSAQVMAFAPDGSEVLVQRPGGGSQVVGTTTSRTRDLGTSRPAAGPAAWSPDGRRLVVTRTDGGLDLLDVTGREPEVVRTVPADAGLQQDVLGWTAPDRLVLAATVTDEGEGDFRVVEVDLADGQQRRLTTVPTDGNFAVSRFQLATALLPELQVQPGGQVDRGPWPVWLQLCTALAVLLVPALALRWRRRRQEGPAAGPSSPHPSSS
ncbi:TolB family protein [Jannaschia sp. R86511]|uniref:TolB family protein n=1 Tax=Jannaschia sp. R86511 TaxID=3093853 RepID=UPI0036D3DEAD